MVLENIYKDCAQPDMLDLRPQTAKEPFCLESACTKSDAFLKEVERKLTALYTILYPLWLFQRSDCLFKKKKQVKTNEF